MRFKSQHLYCQHFHLSICCFFLPDALPKKNAKVSGGTTPQTDQNVPPTTLIVMSHNTSHARIAVPDPFAMGILYPTPVRFIGRVSWNNKLQC